MFQFSLRRFSGKPKKNIQKYSWIIQRPWSIQSPAFTRPPQYDFDAWLYLKSHVPSSNNCHKENGNSNKNESSSSISLFPQLAIAAQDIKFAFNAYNFVRVCRFYGVTDCSVVSPCQNSTPPMDIAARGNRIFHLNCAVNTPLKQDNEKCKVVKVGLTAHPTKGICINDVDWIRVLKIKSGQEKDSPGIVDWIEELTNTKREIVSTTTPTSGVIIQLIVGMENGMSDEIADQCDFCVHIPQFGSIGSLSMVNALTVAMHQIHTALRGQKISEQHTRVAKKTPLLVVQSEEKEQEICQGPDSCNVGKLYPHASNLVGRNDATINHNLARQRKQNFPLQLSLVWWNNLGDRNIGASIRNANIYNVEHMIVLNRRKYSRRGTVGCHHYTPVHHVKDLDQLKEMNLLEGYEKWGLVNEYPYLCNYLFAKRHGISDLNLLCGNQEACYYYNAGDEHYESAKRKTIFLDDEASIVQELQQAKQKRKAKGIAIFVPDEGSTLTPEMEMECSVKLRMINPGKSFGEAKAGVWREHYQAGLPGSISTAVVLDRLRNLIQEHVSF